MTRPLDLGSGTAMSHFAQIRPDPRKGENDD